VRSDIVVVVSPKGQFAARITENIALALGSAQKRGLIRRAEVESFATGASFAIAVSG